MADINSLLKPVDTTPVTTDPEKPNPENTDTSNGTPLTSLLKSTDLFNQSPNVSDKQGVYNLDVNDYSKKLPEN